MIKLISTAILFCVVFSITAYTQASDKPVIAHLTYRPASQDKLSWQWLNIWLSSSHVKIGTYTVNNDSGIIYTSRSLGLSRLPVTADGIDDPELIAKSKWFDQRNPSEGKRLLSHYKKKKHLEQLILIGAYYAFEPSALRRNKDSAEVYLKAAIEESKEIKEKRLGRVALALLGKCYGQITDTKKEEAIYEQLLKECEEEGDKRTAAKALLYRGIYTVYSTDVQKERKLKVIDVIKLRVSYLDTAAKLYRELKNVEGEILATTYMGFFSLRIIQFDQAYKHLLKALDLQNSIGYPYTHYTTDHIVMLRTAQGQFGEPLKYALETIRISEAVRDSIGWATFYSRLGVLYSSIGGREDEALEWMLKAMNRYIMNNDGNIFPTLYTIATLMIQQTGREQEALDLVLSVSEKITGIDSSDLVFKRLAIANAYMGIKEYKIAESYAKSADSVAKLRTGQGLNSMHEKSMINKTLSAIYANSKQFEKAKPLVEMEQEGDTMVVAFANRIMELEKLIKIDSAFNDFEAVAAHYKKYIALVDSNLKASHIRQAEELQVIYETQEKEKQIALMGEQSKVEKANLRQATLMKNVTIGGIVVALIIAALLYRQARLRKKTNKLVTQKNEQLQHLLTEKEWLLKEIHHRVKNNLQIVMSLLNSQSIYIDNEPALTAIHDSQHRVHAMSLIHQKLYGSDNVSSIDMTVYIRELVSYLSDCFNTGQRIRFEYDIDQVEMDVSQAVPLGLILNEAITNSIKYAFPDDRKGLIKISLKKTALQHYLLSISDNGIGMPVLYDNKKPGSLGMSLMQGLSEDLEGEFSIDNSNGTTINISFIHDHSIKKESTLTSSFISNN